MWGEDGRHIPTTTPHARTHWTHLRLQVAEHEAMGVQVLEGKDDRPGIELDVFLEDG